jgi:hypothetical protein
VPAGVARVVVADVARVPAEDHVAETEAGLRRREELLLVDVLAAENAVDVRDRDLDLLDGRFADLVEDVGRLP